MKKMKSFMNKVYTLNQLAAIYNVYKDIDFRTKTVSCCTCGKNIKITQLEDCYNLWGHFVPRSIDRGLIYCPENSHAQCPECNVFINNSHIQNKYTEYMIFRYGKNYKTLFEAFKQKQLDTQQIKDFYVERLLSLLNEFPELSECIGVDLQTGEVKDTIYYSNNIENQFNTYSKHYEQDLDTLCKILRTEYIEYNKL